VEKYGLQLTEEMKAQLGKETPKSLSNVTMEITGSVTQLCEDAAKAAESLGYRPMILTNMLDCEAKDAGRFLASIAKTIQKNGLPLKPPCAIICGGETIVHITGKGKGGRNQELALAAADAISGIEGVVIAAAGSDGTDGPTDAAGGIVDGNTKTLLSEKGISIPAILTENNSKLKGNYAAFGKITDMEVLDAILKAIETNADGSITEATAPKITKISLHESHD
ncbi:MAG: hypothetical protein IJF71_00625, partial [Clostridia bacterium]|nr:hypothetical protein [Clostridia bacterium]